MSLTPKDLRLIAKLMREFGLSKVKMGDIELELTPESPPQLLSSPAQAVPLDAPIEESDPIANKVEQLTSLMKLDDHDLANMLFPENTETEESA